MSEKFRDLKLASGTRTERLTLSHTDILNHILNNMKVRTVFVLLLSQYAAIDALQLGQVSNRRDAIARVASGALAIGSAIPSIASAETGDIVQYEFRDRKGNKNGLVREDYYYMMGRTPPRLLGGALQMDDPQFNAFGACQTKSDGSSTNSCTYVSLKQRIPAYSKYAFSIGLGSKEFVNLREDLKKCAQSNSSADWRTASTYVVTPPQTTPPPPIDALLKMALFASSMLTSPNYSGPSRELLVARFYVNEVSYAMEEISAAIDARDAQRALAAWDFGKDSWNSYFQIVNDKISPKVGDKFDLIV